MRILITMDLVRMWTRGWSLNGTDGMMHTQGNLTYPHQTRLEFFSARSAKEVLCYRDDKKSPEEGACCDGIRADDCVTKYIYGDRCTVRLFAGTGGATRRGRPEYELCE